MSSTVFWQTLFFFFKGGSTSVKFPRTSEKTLTKEKLCITHGLNQRFSFEKKKREKNQWHNRWSITNHLHYDLSQISSFLSPFSLRRLHGASFCSREHGRSYLRGDEILPAILSALCVCQQAPAGLQFVLISPLFARLILSRYKCVCVDTGRAERAGIQYWH